MLALARFEAEFLCPLCGGLASECQAGSRAERAFKAGNPIRCQRRTAQSILTASKEFEKYPHPEALLIPVTYDPALVIPAP